MEKLTWKKTVAGWNARSNTGHTLFLRHLVFDCICPTSVYEYHLAVMKKDEERIVVEFSCENTRRAKVVAEYLLALHVEK